MGSRKPEPDPGQGEVSACDSRLVPSRIVIGDWASRLGLAAHGEEIGWNIYTVPGAPLWRETSDGDPLSRKARSTNESWARGSHQSMISQSAHGGLWVYKLQPLGRLYLQPLRDNGGAVWWTCLAKQLLPVRFLSSVRTGWVTRSSNC